jgi:hypothetical protein
MSALSREREAADEHGIERDRVARIFRRVDRVQSDHLAGQVETQHLLVAVVVDEPRLHHAAAHGIDRAETVAGAEDVLAGAVRSGVLDEHVQLAQRDLVDAGRQAHRTERTRRTEMYLVAVVGDRAYGRLEAGAQRFLHSIHSDPARNAALVYRISPAWCGNLR